MLKINKIQFIILFCIYISFGCTTTRIQREVAAVSEARELNKYANYLKAHMLDGKLYILYYWEVNDKENTVSGVGSLYNANRKLIDKVQSGKNKFIIPLSEVALFETNQIKGFDDHIIPMAIVTGVSVALTTFCLMNPKACFGSCPTIYSSARDSLFLEAEGFSSSISPSLEKKDIDMLYRIRPDGNIVKLKLTNEALETHVIRELNLLLLPKPQKGRTFVTTDEDFFQVTNIISPASCLGPEGDFLSSVAAYDELERFSLTDQKDLATKETLEIIFDSIPEGKYGLIIGKRQTLLTTYLLYQGLAYMGNSVSYWLSKLERNEDNMQHTKLGIWKLLGGIEAYIENKSGEMELIGDLAETGPIATDFNILPLPAMRNESFRIKLRMTKGLWRINYLALGRIGERVEPIRSKPFKVYRGNEEDLTAHLQLNDPYQYLVTLPGDEFNLFYNIPKKNSIYEYFLESRGYYLEWIRDEWIMEENYRKLNQFFNKPSLFLKKAAPKFKKLESSMEETFWRSKYVKQ